MRNVSDKSSRENQNNVLFSIVFFFEIPAVYEKKWINVVAPGRPHMIV
jgi:hypothetical protein